MVRLSLALCLFLAASTASAAPSTAPKKKSLAFISVTRGEGFSEREGMTIEEVLLAALHATGRFKITGRSDLETMLSLEARKQARAGGGRLS